ncbi:Spore cortex-lytic enzyme, lytic transglycosylase SleB [Dehalobacter sp. UNSWDHB]|uniref:spore cortex-lytic enzyme n=1 Tax=unclassified Dehalobacter TaxID=2635733 RepID=UPI00028AD6AD|nr:MULTISPECIES: spore cortex-lytic enzyme [unclassified Dehalobacter]AFV03933.1 Spore cortex-lytic enzyme, lytic transglycosylase SleB [Dehalobacter sp. DCA]AFV06911.1 Spore cortex-lytic enzyme, lytic transglycosylase SleB [Dehalobacter sp. CF]EQB19951.1 Spore cortex-lytic enzyme, lytic transglycosylase SleB [Dehalobacter sp. UNSWDHB]
MDQNFNEKKQKKIFSIITVSLILCLVLSAASQAALGDRTLSKGSRGSEVKALQSKLVQLGYQVGKVDGIYGKSTLAAVKRFQKSRGLKADGIAGDKTIRELKRLTGESTTSSGKQVGFKNADFQLLARCVYAEGRGEPYIGQVAIGACIMNRIKSSSFPKTIAGVIYEPKAFSAVDDGQINLQPDETAIKAAREAMNGSDPTNGAVYYFNPDKTTNKFVWSRPQIKKIGKHIFTR